MLKPYLNNLRPVGDRVLVKITAVTIEERTAGGIILPDGTNEVKIAVIAAIGEKIKTDQINFKIGDKVIYNDFDVKKLKDVNGDEYGLIRYDNVWAVFE